jgi:hypothetical protein
MHIQIRVGNSRSTPLQIPSNIDMKTPRLLMVEVFLAMSCVMALADDEAANGPVVRSSEYGGVYAKSVPAEPYGQKGKTMVFGVGQDCDTLICEYEWYANEMYLGGAGDATVVRFGPWQRGRSPQGEHLALGIYRNGKTVREYSTLEMQQLGSGVSESVSHYTIFKRRFGFRWLKGNDYVYEVEAVGGKVFQLDLTTGSVTEKNAEQNRL